VRVCTALCATRRDVCERRCKDSASGLSQQSGEAEGSLIPEARVRVGAALTRAGRAGTARRSRVRSARRRGVTRVNQWLNPLKRDTGSNLADQGRTAVHASREVCGWRLRSRPNAAGGEVMGKACGVPVARLQGEELGAGPVDRNVVNVGTILELLVLPPGQGGGGGHARCRLSASGWDGGSVVVRAAESVVHGEGTQRVSSTASGTSGGRR